MNLKQIEKLPKGTLLDLELWDGCWQKVELLRITTSTVFPTTTFSDLMNGDFDMSKGKKVRDVLVRTPDGKTRSVSARKLRMPTI